MKLSFSTNAFTRFSVVNAIEKIASIGYEGVELLADAPHLYAHSVKSHEISKIRDTIERSGVKVSNLNANTACGYFGLKLWDPVFEPSLSNPEPKARAWKIDYVKKCVDLAEFFGCGNVSVTSGRMLPGINPEDSLDLLKAALSEVLEYSDEKGIRIGMEYEPGLLIENSTELKRLISEIDSPYFGANLDIGHSFVAGEDPEEAFDLLRDDVFHIHIEDIKERKHYHLIPGLGDMDIPAALGTIENSGYEGFTTVELYTYPHCPEEAARISYEYLINLFKRAL